MLITSEHLSIYQLLVLISIVGYIRSIQVQENSSPLPLPSPSPKMIAVSPGNQHFYKNNYLPKYLHPDEGPNLSMMESRLINMNDNKMNTLPNDVFPDSPIFYFRMPVSAPSPYMYLTEIESFMNHIHHPVAPFVPYNIIPSSVPIHLPIVFTSNGKPNGIYRYPQHDLQLTKPTVKPTPKPNTVNLNKGPYNFNGKPNDIYLLQDSFNSLFSNSLSGLYP